MASDVALNNSRSVSTHRLVIGFILSLSLFALFIIAGAGPLLTRFGREQWGREEFQFFPLMILAAAFVAWQRIRELPPGALQPGVSVFRFVLSGLSLFTFASAILLWSGRLTAISVLLMLIAIVWQIGGRTLLKTFIPSFMLLSLIIGPPLGADVYILQTLREIAVYVSSGLLIILNVPHLTTGTIIEIPGARLLVAEACSGINSLMAVLGCTMVIAFIRRRSWPVVIFLLLTGVLFVLWANIVRIASGVWLEVFYDIDILSGEAHELASLILFTLCIALVLCTDEAVNLLRRLLSVDEQASDEPFTPPVLNQKPVLRIGLAFWAFAVFFAIIGTAGTAYAHMNGGLSRWLNEPGAVGLSQDAFFTSPQQLGNWTRSEDAERQLAQPEVEGMRSAVWAYRQGPLLALLAIDYPFRGYHDLTLCYRNGGYIIEEFKTHREADGGGFFATIDLQRMNERAVVWFSPLDESGNWVEPPATTFFGRLRDRLNHVGQPDWHRATYQIQVFVHGYVEFTEADRAQIQELFLLGRRELARQVISQLEVRP